MAETGTALTPIAQVREELAPLKTDFSAVLPSHISPDKFAQTIITALERDPALLLADRQSLFVAAKEAANDGLLPDKKEGAFVVYKTKVMVPTGRGHAKEERWIEACKWLPMIFGVRKKMFQTGKVKDIQVEMVHEHDVFRRTAGDNAEIYHEPLDFGDRGDIKGCYAIISTIDGGVFREVMTMAQINAVAAVAKSDKVWNGPFRGEMIRKTVLRRLAKQVPLSAEVDQVLARDDALYNLDHERRALLDGPAPVGVPKRNVFGHRAVKRALAAPVEDAITEAAVVEAAGDDAPASEVATVDERAETLTKAVTDMRHAADATALAEIIETIKADERLQDLTDDEKAWLEETSRARFAELFTETPPRLRAIISSATGEREYQDADVWMNDILAKLSSLKGDPAAVFWKKNLEFILEAGEGGFDAQAERLMEVAAERGLPTDPPA